MRTVSAGAGRLHSVRCAGAVGPTGGRQGVAANVFCLLQADLAGHSMNPEDWNAEMGDEASPILPPLEQVWGGNCWAVVCLLLFPLLPPLALWPRWLVGLRSPVPVIPEAPGGTCP